MSKAVIFPDTRAIALGEQVMCWSEATEEGFRCAFGWNIKDFAASAGDQIAFYDNCVMMSAKGFTGVMVFMTPNPNFVKDLRTVQRAWRKKRAERQLAVMMALHERLGQMSMLSNLDEGLARMCCP